MVNFTGRQTLDQIMINFLGTLEKLGLAFSRLCLLHS